MKKQECPIRFECVDGGYRCCNYLQCFDKAISWEIPYCIQDSALIVRPYGWRCEWDDEAHGTYKRFCPLPSGSYNRLDGSDHESEMKDRLRQAWIDAGWAAAVPITDKPCSSTRTEQRETTSTASSSQQQELNIDSIPF